MPNLIKSLSGTNGRALSNRYQIKRFKERCDMHAFLSKGDNSLYWRELKGQELKSGIYFSQTGLDCVTKYISESALR